MSKKRPFGWNFLNSDDYSKTYDGEYGRGERYSDGSGYWEGEDGSRGERNPDGSGYWEGADGVEGEWNSHGSGYYNGEYFDWDSFAWKSRSAMTGIFTTVFENALGVRKDRPRDNTDDILEEDEDDYSYDEDDYSIDADEEDDDYDYSPEDTNYNKVSYKSKNSDSHGTIGIIMILLISLLAFGGIMAMLFWTTPKVGKDEIKVPTSACEYKGKDYKTVKTEFENMGFEEVECEGLEDLKIGLLKKENTIERISIAGNAEFYSGDIFKKDDKVVITYHSFKEKD